MSKKEDTQQNTYHSGNKFFIVDNFNNKLRDGIIIPLTNKIEELSKQKDATIDIYINSHGGDGELCLHLVALLELAKSKEVKVRTIVTQVANSAGSVLAVVGTPGERYIGRTAEHCVHYGQQHGWTERTPLQISRNTDHKKRWFNIVLKHYEKYCDIPGLEDALKDDSFFITSAQAIKWGMADKYLDKLK